MTTIYIISGIILLAVILYFALQPEEVTVNPMQINLLSFAIDDYPGTANDLEWCLHDQTILTEGLGIQFHKYYDNQVNKSLFRIQLKDNISYLRKGDWLVIHYSGHGTQVYDVSDDESDGFDEALYLYDGALIDDDINEILQEIPAGAKVLLIFDSCFSGDVTKAEHSRKIRFLQTYPIRRKTVSKLAKTDMKWIVFSACAETQYSYENVFTPALVKAFNPGLTVQEWFDRTVANMKEWEGVQDPQLDGDESLFNLKLFQ